MNEAKPSFNHKSLHQSIVTKSPIYISIVQQFDIRINDQIVYGRAYEPNHW